MSATVTLRNRIRLLRAALPEGDELSSITLSDVELLDLMADIEIMQYIEIDRHEARNLKFDGVLIMVE